VSIGDGVVWKDVMGLSGNIHVDYSTVEELFASRTIQPRETEKVKKSAEVDNTIHYNAI